MTAALVILFLYIAPLWFMLRMWYFDEYFDGVDKVFCTFFVLLLSWVGLFITSRIKNVTGQDMCRTFFLPVREKTVESRMFWDKIRRFFLIFLLIREPK